MKTPALWLSLALVACAGDTRIDVEDFARTECPGEPDTDPPPEALLLVGGEGRITVAHRGFSANCCREIEPSATLDAEEAAIAVTYEESGDECDCTCVYDLGYALVGIPAGAWTVTAAGEAGLVTVD